MPRINRILALALVFLPLLASCNIYKSLSSPSTQAEYVEEAQKCLVDRDYDCAIAAYGHLTDATVKSEKLCIVNLAKAGLGISALITIATNGGSGSDILREMAEALLPYTATKEAAAEEAITQCASMAAGDTKKLLQSMSYLVDCSVRIAKTDTLVSIATTGGTTTCDSATAGNGDGSITADDICPDGTGALGSGNPGMCEKDVLACVSDVDQVSTLSGGLSSANLSGLAQNITSLAALSGAATAPGRATIRGFIQ